MAPHMLATDASQVTAFAVVKLNAFGGLGIEATMAAALVSDYKASLVSIFGSLCLFAPFWHFG